jgi:biopolymer transport protein ExbD
MARKTNNRGAVAPEMNITPLIDVVFLLIIFFMLVSRIVAEEREPMIVPRLDQPEAKELITDNRLVVNVARIEPAVNQRKEQMDAKDTHLAGPGAAQYVKIGLKKYSLSQLPQITQRLSRLHEANPKLEVLLRADAGLHYREVAPVLRAITSAEIGKVNLVAYTEHEPF